MMAHLFDVAGMILQVPLVQLGLVLTLLALVQDAWAERVTS